MIQVVSLIPYHLGKSSYQYRKLFTSSSSWRPAKGTSCKQPFLKRVVSGLLGNSCLYTICPTLAFPLPSHHKLQLYQTGCSQACNTAIYPSAQEITLNPEYTRFASLQSSSRGTSTVTPVKPSLIPCGQSSHILLLCYHYTLSIHP